MDLERVVAAPFKQQGSDRVEESKFVVGLSLDRNWYSPDQASRIVELGIRNGLLTRDGNELVAQFSPESVSIPPDFNPADEPVAQESPFEIILRQLTDDGMEKQSVVAEINQLQGELGISVDAAAVVFAKSHKRDVTGATQAMFE